MKWFLAAGTGEVEPWVYDPSIVILALVGCAVTWLLVPLLRRNFRGSKRRQLHHTHDAPVCRFGGLSLALSFLAVVTVAYWKIQPLHPEVKTLEPLVIIGASMAMFLLGFVDDIWPLGARRKLLGQVLIATAVFAAGINSDIHLSITTFRNPFTHVDYPLGAWSYVATVFWLVAFTNLINLIDGVDGLAAGVSLIVMSLLLFVGCQSGSLFSVVCAAGMCGALLGFLCYNFPPATIYLGDGGAYLLGFLLGILSMSQAHKGTVVAALIAPLFVLALPIADVGLAIARRGLKGIPIFRPDQRHLHHRLAQAGLSRTRIVLLFYACSLFFLFLAMGVFLSQGTWLPLLFGVACLILLASARSFRFSRNWFDVSRVLGDSARVRKDNRYALALGRWLELEAQRSSSPDELWEDFGFIAKKLGFSSVCLSTPLGQRHWTSPVERSPGVPSHRRRFELPPDFTIEFTASSEKLNATPFEFLTELAADTWLKAISSWQNTHKLDPQPRSIQRANLRTVPVGSLAATVRGSNGLL